MGRHCGGLLQTVGPGATTTTYTQDLAASLDQILSDGSSIYLYGMERRAAAASGTQVWYDADALGSVRQTLDASGTPSSSPIWYDPWGQGAERYAADRIAVQPPAGGVGTMMTKMH